MSKKVYVGVDNTARKVKRIYVGVDNVAKRIKKAYIGIGGVARPCFGVGLEYYGSIEPLSVGRWSLASTTVGDYALFGGGDYGALTDVVDAYDKSLTRTNPTSLSKRKRDLAATTVGDYALFSGGYISGSDSTTDTVDAYDKSLTKIIPTSLSPSNNQDTSLPLKKPVSLHTTSYPLKPRKLPEY